MNNSNDSAQKRPANPRKIFVTDVDNTIADVRERFRLSLVDIGREEIIPEVSDSYGGFRDYLSDEETEELFDVFLSDHYLDHDDPAPHAPEVLTRIHSRGYRLIYLTGRPDGRNGSLRKGTVRWLEEHGFPAPDGRKVLLKMKPERKMNDREFKTSALREARVAEGSLGVGDLPDDARAYASCGMHPVLIDWFGLFDRETLLSAAPGVELVDDWGQIEELIF